MSQETKSIVVRIENNKKYDINAEDIRQHYYDLGEHDITVTELKPSLSAEGEDKWIKGNEPKGIDIETFGWYEIYCEGQPETEFDYWFKDGWRINYTENIIQYRKAKTSNPPTL
jgi:hypothetical protein